MNKNTETPSLQTSGTGKGLSPVKAVLFGHLMITLPALIIITIFILIGLRIVGYGELLFFPLLLGCVVAWLWWSFMVPRWRRWSLQNGSDPKKVQKLAEMTLLVWKKGSIFESTEFQLKDEAYFKKQEYLKLRKR